MRLGGFESTIGGGDKGNGIKWTNLVKMNNFLVKLDNRNQVFINLVGQKGINMYIAETNYISLFHSYQIKYRQKINKQ